MNLRASFAIASLLTAGALLTVPLVSARAAPGAPAASTAQPAPNFEKAMEARVKEYVLSNGLRLLVLERHEVPTVSFVTMANVGSVDEHVGITGVAHIFEHMAFKGSAEIGTTDYAAEKVALAKVDDVFERLTAAREKVERAEGTLIAVLETERKALADARDAKKTFDAARLAHLDELFTPIAPLEKEFKAREDDARQYVVNNEYSVIVERNGGSGLNASTSEDRTEYHINFPSNKAELWFMLEADRFKEPVLREFYKEKGVVMEERRMRTESSPEGKLLEEFQAAAFKAAPYAYPTIGHASDIAHLRRSEAAAFFREHYVPNNLTVAVVGDVDFETMKGFADKYFGELKRGPDYKPVETVEPPQQGEKRVEVESPAQPIVVIGWHRPAASSPDDQVYDVIDSILENGRTSRFHAHLVKEKQLAVQAGCDSSYPGVKYPNIFLAYGLPSVGHTIDELEKALEDEVAALTTEKVTDEELARVKTHVRAQTIRGMDSNSSLAMQLVNAQTMLGDWREAFHEVAKVDAVTADDVMRVAKATFTKKNRIVGRIVPPENEKE